MTRLSPKLFFERNEFEARIQRTRQAMAAADIDLLIVTDPANMAWLTGYDGWSFYVHQCVLLPMEGEPVWFGREMDAQGALRTTFMKPENITCYPDTTSRRRSTIPWNTCASRSSSPGAGPGCGLGWKWTPTISPPPLSKP